MFTERINLIHQNFVKFHCLHFLNLNFMVYLPKNCLSYMLSLLVLWYPPSKDEKSSYTSALEATYQLHCRSFGERFHLNLLPLNFHLHPHLLIILHLFKFPICNWKLSISYKENLILYYKIDSDFIYYH